MYSHIARGEATNFVTGVPGGSQKRYADVLSAWTAWVAAFKEGRILYEVHPNSVFPALVTWKELNRRMRAQQRPNASADHMHASTNVANTDTPASADAVADIYACAAANTAGTCGSSAASTATAATSATYVPITATATAATPAPAAASAAPTAATGTVPPTPTPIPPAAPAVCTTGFLLSSMSMNSVYVVIKGRWPGIYSNR
jgi:hypothetical protein